MTSGVRIASVTSSPSASTRSPVEADVGVSLAAREGHGAVHRARVEVRPAERVGDGAGDGGLAGPRGAVDGDEHAIPTIDATVRTSGPVTTRAFATITNREAPAATPRARLRAALDRDDRLAARRRHLHGRRRVAGLRAAQRPERARARRARVDGRPGAVHPARRRPERPAGPPARDDRRRRAARGLAAHHRRALDQRRARALDARGARARPRHRRGVLRAGVQRARPRHPRAAADPAGQRDRADRPPGGAQLPRAGDRRRARGARRPRHVVHHRRRDLRVQRVLHLRDPHAHRGRPRARGRRRGGAARGHRLRAHADLAVGHAGRGVAGDPVLHGPDPGARALRRQERPRRRIRLLRPDPRARGRRRDPDVRVGRRPWACRGARSAG